MAETVPVSRLDAADNLRKIHSGRALFCTSSTAQKNAAGISRSLGDRLSVSRSLVWTSCRLRTRTVPRSMQSTSGTTHRRPAVRSTSTDARCADDTSWYPVTIVSFHRHSTRDRKEHFYFVSSPRVQLRRGEACQGPEVVGSKPTTPLHIMDVYTRLATADESANDNHVHVK